MKLWWCKSQESRDRQKERKGAIDGVIKSIERVEGGGGLWVVDRRWVLRLGPVVEERERRG